MPSSRAQRETPRRLRPHDVTQYKKKHILRAPMSFAAAALTAALTATETASTAVCSRVAVACLGHSPQWQHERHDMWSSRLEGEQ